MVLFEPPLFKTPLKAVVSTGSAQQNVGEAGQLKRCTHIREADFKPPKTPVYDYNLWKANLSHGFYFDLEVR